MSKETILERFLPRTEFESYEDFKENYRVNVPEGFNFAYDVIDEWTKIDPEKPALVWCDGTGAERRFTFGDVTRYSNKAANALRSIGIGKGDAVLFMLKQRPEAWFTFLALHKLGAVAIPASFQLTKKDLVYRAGAADIKAFLTVDDDFLINNITEALPESPSIENVLVVGDKIPEGWLDYRALIESASDELERVSTKNDDPMLIYFTSGTTGMPKMALHHFEYPLGHIVTAKYWQCVEDGGLHLTMSDSGWAKFAWGKIYGQWICGAVLVAYDEERFDALNLLKTIDRLKLTTFCAPPTIFRFLIKEDLSKYDFSTIKHTCIAGEPLNPEVFRQFYERTGLKLTEGFGQSESTVMIANFPWIEVKPGSTGKPSPLYDIDIVDENGSSCEDGIVGRIVVKNTDKAHPTGLFHCYYRDEAATSKCWQDGVYDTGDTAWRDSDGYIWFEGRSDDVIKCSGYRIGPFEVESALVSHPAVIECAITAVPDPVRGQVVKATIVLSRGYEPSPELTKELQNHVKRVTAPYKYPRVVEYVDELPKTIGGKIKRAEIRSRDN